jgi:hypothetical protein
MADHPLQATAASLGAVLRQLALDIVEAQVALDRHAEERAADVSENGSPLPALAFFFPEVLVDLTVAMTVSRIRGASTLAVTPANPVSSGFFQASSFSSRVRATIAPRSLLVPISGEPEDSNV